MVKDKGYAAVMVICINAVVHVPMIMASYPSCLKCGGYL